MNNLNTQHPSIRYTIELEKDEQIAFLDTLLKKTNNGLKISVYHKTTYTGLLMSFLSFTSFIYKKGLIKCLVDRIYKINNTWKGFDSDIEEMSHTLQKNCFPSRIIDKIIKEYLDKNMHDNKLETKKEEEVRYFKLPYLGNISKQTRNKINILASKLCKNIKLNIVFTSCKINRFFSTKDTLPKFSKSLVVYKFICPVCNSWYVGYTTRNLLTRICEHLGKDSNSHILQHISTCENAMHIANENHFSILDEATSEYELKIKEALHIKWENPTINKQMKHVNINLSV